MPINHKFIQECVLLQVLASLEVSTEVRYRTLLQTAIILWAYLLSKEIQITSKKTH
jgi:hypothetical protein